MASRVKKLKPSEVETFKPVANRYAHIKTLRHVVQFRDVPFAQSSEELASAPFLAYAAAVQPILAQTLFELDDDNGALNLKSAHRRQSTIVQALRAAEIKQLEVLRNELLDHLNVHFYAISRPPPLAGGDTARWSIAATMWLLVCILNCVLRRFGLGADKIDRYKASEQAYLCAELLVIDPAPCMAYSLRSLQMTMQNLIERLDSLQSFHTQLEDFVGVLMHRTSELICGGGTAANGYDANEWCSLIEHAHTGQRPGSTATTKGQVFACTTEFISQSMIWFVTVNNYIANYYQLAEKPLRPAAVDMAAERFDVAQTRSMAWYPTHALMYRVVEFYCEYANDCMDDTYANGLRDFCAQFETAPDQPIVYRVQNKTDKAPPADVLSQQTANLSPVGKEYVRIIKYGIPLKEWLHRSWNWRYGETRIRSGYMGTNRFYTDLVVLYIISLYFYNKTRVWFRNQFILYHRSAAFTAVCHKGKATGYPFIVQQFGWWSVFVPHRTDPRFIDPGTVWPPPVLGPKPDARAKPRVAKFRDADDDDTGRSSEVFGEAKPATDWKQEMEAIAAGDRRGDDIALDAPQLMSAKATDELPIPEYCRVYDCESFLEAWVVWAIWLLNVKRGVINNVDISPFLCDLLGVPRINVREIGAAVDEEVL